MNEKKTREISKRYIKKNNSLYTKEFCKASYIGWSFGSSLVVLDETFRIGDLEAIAWWSKKYGL